MLATRIVVLYCVSISQFATRSLYQCEVRRTVATREFDNNLTLSSCHIVGALQHLIFQESR
jgi:hypothetical protein